MDTFSRFRAVHTSGLVVFKPSEVTALSLLFETTYLPRNLTLVTQFAKAFRFRARPETDNLRVRMRLESGEAVDGELQQIGFCKSEGTDPKRRMASYWHPAAKPTATHYECANSCVRCSNEFCGKHAND